MAFAGKRAFKTSYIPVENSLYKSLTLFTHSRKVLQLWIFTQRPVFQVCFHSRRVLIWESHFLQRTQYLKKAPYPSGVGGHLPHGSLPASICSNLVLPFVAHTFCLFSFLMSALQCQPLKSIPPLQCKSCLADAKSLGNMFMFLTFSSSLHLLMQQSFVSSLHCIFYLETICISFIKLRVYFLGFMMTVMFISSHYEYCSGNFVCQFIKHKSCLILYFVTFSLGDHGKRQSSSSEKAPWYLKQQNYKPINIHY